MDAQLFFVVLSVKLGPVVFEIVTYSWGGVGKHLTTLFIVKCIL